MRRSFTIVGLVWLGLAAQGCAPTANDRQTSSSTGFEFKQCLRLGQSNLLAPAIGDLFINEVIKRFPGELYTCPNGPLVEETQPGALLPAATRTFRQSFGGHLIRMGTTSTLEISDMQVQTAHSVNDRLDAFWRVSETLGWTPTLREDLRPNFEPVIERWRAHGYQFKTPSPGTVYEGIFNAFLFLEVPGTGEFVYVDCNYNPTSDLCDCAAQGPVLVPPRTSWDVFVPDLPSKVFNALTPTLPQTGSSVEAAQLANARFSRAIALALVGIAPPDIKRAGLVPADEDLFAQAAALEVLHERLKQRMWRVGMPVPTHATHAFALLHGITNAQNATLFSETSRTIIRADGKPVAPSDRQLLISHLTAIGLTRPQIAATIGIQDHKTVTIQRKQLALRLGLPPTIQFEGTLLELHRILSGQTLACNPSRFRITEPKQCFPVGMRKEGGRWIDIPAADISRPRIVERIPAGFPLCASSEVRTNETGIPQDFGGFRVDAATLAFQAVGMRALRNFMRSVGLEGSGPFVAIDGPGVFQPLVDHPVATEQADLWIMNQVTNRDLDDAEDRSAIDDAFHVQALGHRLFFLATSVWADCNYNGLTPGCNGRKTGIALVPPDTDWSSAPTRLDYLASFIGDTGDKATPQSQAVNRLVLEGLARGLTSTATQASLTAQGLASGKVLDRTGEIFALLGAPRDTKGARSYAIAAIWGMDWGTISERWLRLEDGTRVFLSGEMIDLLRRFSLGATVQDVANDPDFPLATRAINTRMRNLKAAVARAPDLPPDMTLQQLLLRVWSLVNRYHRNPNEIELTRTAIYSADLQHVWDKVITHDFVRSWDANYGFQGRYGQEYAFYGPRDRLFFGRITGVDPPNRLTYTWQTEFGPETNVTWELTSSGPNTVVTVRHEGFDDPPNRELLSLANETWEHAFNELKSAFDH